MKYQSRGPFDFLGASIELKKANAVVLPVPFDSTTSYKSGTREGPSAIISASRQLEWYDLEFKCSPANVLGGFHTLEELDVSVDSPRKTSERVRQAVSEILKLNKLPVTLGGDHSISLGCFEAVKAKYPDVSVMHFDAHADLRDEFDDSKYSHACVLRRIAELGPKIAQVGLRSTEETGEEYIAKNKDQVKVFPSHSKNKWDLNELLCHLTEEVYITFDVDCLDPSIMPSTGTPVPGGLMWHDVLNVLREVGKNKRIVGFDVTELMPLPGFHAADFLAANLVYKIWAY
ncbi:agmatinase, partial [Candidatus Micrarchaeota archaeon]|nr:agmatinase [Candidatus Micrarchaeota archaeon]